MTCIESYALSAIVRDLPEIVKQLKLKNKLELLKLKTNYELSIEDRIEVAKLEAEFD